KILVYLAELELVHHASWQQSGIADAFDPHLAEHLRYDDFDVLVVDIHALAAIHILNFTREILLHGLFAGNAKNVVRHKRAVDQGFASSHEVARVDAKVFAVADQVLAFDAAFAADNDRPLAAALFAQDFDAA